MSDSGSVLNKYFLKECYKLSFTVTLDMLKSSPQNTRVASQPVAVHELVRAMREYLYCSSVHVEMLLCVFTRITCLVRGGQRLAGIQTAV